LDRKTFIYALTSSPHLSFNDPSGLAYELLWDCFVPDDSINGFDYFLRYIGTSFVVISSINIMLACCNATFSFEKTNWRHLTHYDWRGDLLVNRLHTNYSIQGYI
jgi:hypothetical protein